MAVVGGRRRGQRSGRHDDGLIALAVTIIVVTGTLFDDHDPGHPDALNVWGWLLILLACAALLVRSRFPVTVALLALASCCVYYPVFAVDGPLMVTFAVGLYTVAARGHLTVAVLMAVGTMLAVGYGEAGAEYRNVDDATMFLLAGWLVAVISIGAVQRNRLAYLHEVEQRAAVAERGRVEESRRQASEERLRIARELHDALGHNISLINVQASAALHRFDEDPAQARAALDAVKKASGSALRELRATLGMLRQVDEAAPAILSPSLDRVDELAAQARSTGLAVTVEVTGAARELPAEVDRAAYRIIQEALTNVARHANAGTAHVTIGYEREDVRVTVDDDGRGGVPVPGNGLRGMDERARALGGELAVGSRREGGLRVTVRLPTGAGR
ncbi:MULTISPECIES: sensor histidine kinase [Actinoalloteichus]|uniref:histidine kinase n=1 Tax=Actinoalloteichus fjordicus TaxID=1612552 RepID=A0AAC9PTZ9_9PSEU|nr:MULTISPECIES: sensor histidine kinase [Actinoalloteichus]APU16673.1 signal transduction histidine kinase [Actinoalloteichus fjordicus]APU22739.1 signal transduction histidine kinase [Actinoalloteichus sp. GBA129-24]